MDIEKTISEMSIDEKILLLAGRSRWETESVDRLDVPSVVMTDGPHGVRLRDIQTGETKPATAFPVASAMAATWNPALIESAGRAMAEESQHYGISVLLGPGVNGKRSPLGGRNFEYYSEDPYLAGAVGTAWVRGLQSGGVGASVKHFVANEQEKNRMVTSSQVGERALREIYLAPFETIIRNANPWTVMCSYNRVNGEYMSENDRFLNGILKGEWSYDGAVVSDWGAVSDKVQSVQNGLDLEMPGPGRRNHEVKDAFGRGQITEAQIDDHVRRLLRLIERAANGKRTVESVNFDVHHALATRVAEESLVLLKNDKQLLPLPEGANVAVIGGFAETPRIQGGGSSHMNPAQLSMPVDEIGKFCNAVYKPGYRDDVTDEELISDAVSAAGAADSVVVFVGTTDQIEGEGYDRADIGLPAAHLQLFRAVAAVNQRVVVVNMSGSAVDLRPILEESRAVLHAWLPGQAGGAAIARVLFGLADPSGRLSETFPVELEHNPSYLSFPGTIDSVDYTEGVFVGYRHYDTRKLPVTFPFGYGLSYTSFVYEDLRVQQLGSDGSPSFCVTVDIRNAGDRPGAEVVQLYIRDVSSFEPRPTSELKGFAKVALEPDASETVTLELDGRAFSWYVEHLGRFAVESGEFVIEVGSSSRDIRLSHTVSVVSADTVRPRLTEQHDLREFLAEGDPGDNMHRAYEKVAESSGRRPLLRLFEGSPVNKMLGILPLFGASEESVDELKKAVYDAMGKPVPEA